MKEIQEQHKDNVKFEKPAISDKKLMLVNKQRMKKNHTLYEFNFKENTITPVKYHDGDVADFTKAIKGESLSKKRVVQQPNCVYVPALNVKNAIKHIHNKIMDGLNPRVI